MQPLKEVLHEIRLESGSVTPDRTSRLVIVHNWHKNYTQWSKRQRQSWGIHCWRQWKSIL